jgi:hypothetical protein
VLDMTLDAICELARDLLPKVETIIFTKEDACRHRAFVLLAL